ncbi:unnamed protein product [Prorocentrum cordatum]|uniref:Uncharacterized protein n=1 Tax=Prorocentrum cordatum TaxID=2364126 RepID=A0ABN9Q0Y0_9DINO|nr:unnamed protein product [Polarella glacialis]
MPPRDRDHGFQQNACPANVAETWGGNSGSYAPEQAEEEEEEEEEDEEERERERERGQNPTKKSAKRATTRAQPIGSTSRRDSPEVDSGAGTRPLGAKHSPEKTAVMRVVAPLGTSQNEQLRIPTRGHWHAAAAPWTGQRRPWRAPWPACNGHRGQFVPRSPAAARLPQLTTERGLEPFFPRDMQQTYWNMNSPLGTDIKRASADPSATLNRNETARTFSQPYPVLIVKPVGKHPADFLASGDFSLVVRVLSFSISGSFISISCLFCFSSVIICFLMVSISARRC